MSSGTEPAGPPRTLVLALGHPDRGDDGAGPGVARRLRERLRERPGGTGSPAAGRVEIRELPGEATEILAAWEGFERVVVIDAVRSGAGAEAAPGTVHRLEPADLPADWETSPSSHGLGLGQALALARTLGRLPPALTIYGIEAGTFEPGAGLTPSVERAAERVANELAARVERPVIA